MHSDTRGMAFLLSLGALPIACTIACNSEGSGGSNSAGTGTETGTTSATTTATDPGTTNSTATTDAPTSTSTPTTTDPTTDPGPTSTPPETTSSSTTTEPATSATTGSTTFVTSNTDTTATSETGLPPTDDMGCIAYAAKVIECFPRYADYRGTIASQCAEYKMQGLELDGQPCADAIEAQNVCFSQVDCDTLENGEPCPRETAAVAAACPTAGGSGSESGNFGSTGG